MYEKERASKGPVLFFC